MSPGGQITMVIPPGVVPGSTHLSVAVGEDEKVLVKVPLGASAGDKLLLTRENSRWHCALLRNCYSKDGKGPPSQHSIRLLVPPHAVPGESKLAVGAGDGTYIHLPVPSAARPGDLINLKKSPASPEDDESTAEEWQCELIRDRIPPRTLDDCREKVAQLRSLHAAPLNADTACSELYEAARAAGGYVSPKLTRGSVAPLFIPGILAAEPIEEGEVLCRMPMRLHLSPLTVEEVAPEYWREFMSITELPELRRQESAEGIFLAQLLHEAEDRAAGITATDPESLLAARADDDVLAVWQSYADGLLSEDFAFHPYRRAAAEPDQIRAAFEPSREAEYFIEMVKDIHSTYQIITEKCSGLLPARWPDFDMFFRARLCILTRIFQTNTDLTLVPVVDLFNHASDMTHGVSWCWNEQEQEMTAVARRAHAGGEELFVSYGPRSNLLLYRTYGFTEPPSSEPGWTYLLSPESVRAIYDSFLPKGAARFPVLLDSKHIEDTLCELLNQVVKTGRDAAELLRFVCARSLWLYEHSEALQPTLQALRRARAQDPGSSAWWAELPSEDASLADDDCMRIRMCEYLCLVAHAEAVDFFEGSLPEEQCLRGTEHLRGILGDALRMVKEGRPCRLKRVLESCPE